MHLSMPESRELSGGFISWIILIGYFVVAFMVGIAVLRLDGKIPEDNTDELSMETTPLANGVIATTSIAVILMFAMAIFSDNRSSVWGILTGCFDKSGTKFKVMSGITIVCLLISVILTTIVEVVASNKIESCHKVQIKDKVEAEEFMESVEMVNRLYGAVLTYIAIAILMLLTLFGGFISSLSLKMPFGKRLTVSGMYSFGRNAKCSRRNGLKKRA